MNVIVRIKFAFTRSYTCFFSQHTETCILFQQAPLAMAQGAQSLSAMGKLRAWPDEKSDEERSRTARSRSRDRASRRSERKADHVADAPAKAAQPTAPAVAAVADASANAAEHRTPPVHARPSEDAAPLPP